MAQIPKIHLTHCHRNTNNRQPYYLLTYFKNASRKKIKYDKITEVDEIVP